MMTTRDIRGVFWRSLPQTLRLANLFGGQTVKTKKCSCCGKILPITNFFKKSKTNRKHEDDVRSVCIDCWAENKGRVNNSVCNSFDVEEFMMENN